MSNAPAAYDPTRYTPGPWDYDRDFIVAPDPAGRHPDITIAEIAHADEDGRVADPEQQDANRRLIAAAPELLDALDYLLEQTVDMDLKHGIELSEGEEDARAKALAAIAKAAGRPVVERWEHGDRAEPVRGCAAVAEGCRAEMACIPAADGAPLPQQTPGKEGVMDKVRMTLAGRDGNGMSLVAAFRRHARAQGWSEDQIEAVSDDALSGDYDHLLRTLLNHITGEPDDGDEGR